MEYLNMYLYENTVRDYLFVLITFIALVIIFRVTIYFLDRVVSKVVLKTKTTLDDFAMAIVKSFHPPFYYFLAFYIAISDLVLNSLIKDGLWIILIIWISYQIIQVPHILIDYMAARTQGNSDDPEKRNAAYFLGIIAKIALWSIAILMVLSNLGINITSLVAGLGIGGIAIALALQTILGDLFSSFAIYFDKPFQAGDFIVVNGQMGVVQKIGIKTTRIKALQGEELIIPNSHLISSTVQNFKQMHERRVLFSIGLVYNTSAEKVLKATEIIKNIIEEKENVRFDRSNFSAFGNFSLNIETVYYLKSSDYNTYMNIQQDVLLEIKRQFIKEKLDFAFPTQTVYLEK